MNAIQTLALIAATVWFLALATYILDRCVNKSRISPEHRWQLLGLTSSIDSSLKRAIVPGRINTVSGLIEYLAQLDTELRDTACLVEATSFHSTPKGI